MHILSYSHLVDDAAELLFSHQVPLSDDGKIILIFKKKKSHVFVIQIEV